MIEAGLFIAGLAIGGIVAYLLAASRARAASAAAAGELQSRLSVAQSTAGELRSRIADGEQALQTLRADLQSEQAARVEAQTRHAEAIKNIDEQKRLLEEAEKRLKETFDALSLKALRANSEEFTKRAAENVKPLTDALKRYEEHIREIEQTRQKAYGSLTEQLKQLSTQSGELSRQTTTLSTALRSPQVKGRWGEMQLRNAVEIAGMSAHCDFIEQKTFSGDEQRAARPDLVVRLPGERTIVVDSKAPTSAYLDAIDADNEDARRAALDQHVRSVREHMRALGAKGYAGRVEHSPEFVVMFLPGEAFFSAALEQDRGLIEEGIRNGVILASPTTLIALLRTVAHSWQQQALLENARQIGETAAELFDRVCKFAEHFGKTGEGLKRAAEAYDRAVGSWERRVLPMGTKISDLGVRAKSAKSMDLAKIDPTIRALPDVPNLVESDDLSEVDD